MFKHRNAAPLFAVSALCLVALAAILLIGLAAPDLGAHAHLASGLDPFSILTASPALIALRDKRKEISASMQAMVEASEAEDREMTAEEEAGFDKLRAERDGVDKRIKRIEDLQASTAPTVIPAASRGGGIVHPPAPVASREFESIGQFMSAVRFNPNDQRLNYVEGADAEDGSGGLTAEMRMDNDRSGGFMVPPQFRDTIMAVRPQDALVRPRATVIPAGSPPDAAITMPALDQSGSTPGSMFGGMEFQWIEEGGEKPETDAALRGITLSPHEIAGTVTVTDKLLRNWQASATFLENLMRGGVQAAEDYAFQRGSGVNQPLGALNAGATKWISRAQANRVSYADLLQMVSTLLMRGGTPVWSMPQGALPQIATMTDPEGHYIWKAGAVDGFAGTLLGYPVRWNNRAPLLGQRGDILLADWTYYLIKDGSGPFVAASEHVLFRRNKTVIKIFWNVDGAPWMHAPIKEENGYEVSPFVALDVPA